MNLRTGADFAASLSMIAASGAVIWLSLNDKPRREPLAITTEAAIEEPLPDEAIPLGPVQVGSSNAPAAMVLFSDFSCGYCAEFSRKTLPILQQEYIQTGQLLLVLRQLSRPGQQNLAAAAKCGLDHQQFWPMFSWLFTKPLDEEISAKAMSLGVNRESWTRCLRSEGVAELLQDDHNLAKSLNVRGTPTIFFGKLGKDGIRLSHRFRGTRTIEVLRPVIAALLTRSH